jgi:HD-like signal output (HDOD) protein/ActR/RegA family two-component response regulator
LKPLSLLLVDDERGVLDGLRRLLRPLRTDWDVRVAASGSEALALMSQQPADVVITDMRMPVMDGAELLGLVQSRSPSTVRVVLSGQTDLSAAVRVLPTAHQFLSKPCDPAELIESLSRIHEAFQGLGPCTTGPTLVGAIGALPSTPSVWEAFSRQLADPRATAGDVADVVETCPGLTSKVLQLTNSPFFGLRRRTSKVGEAVAYLGLPLLRNLVNAVGAAGAPDLPKASRFHAEDFHRRALRTARLARALAARPEDADACYSAGLLFDVGKLVLASRAPDLYDQIDLSAASLGCTFEQAEALGHSAAPHHRLGTFLLKLWGLPAPLTSTLTHLPGVPADGAQTLAPAGAVHLARQLLEEVERGTASVDLEFVERLGVGAQLGRFRALAEHLVAA